MKRATLLGAMVIFQATAAAPEPLVGTWRLERQEINGEARNFEPLTLKITPPGDWMGRRLT